MCSSIIWMANKKNKRHHYNSHRRVFRKRHVYKCKVRQSPPRQLGSPPRQLPTRSRIININKLQSYLDRLTSHASQCGGMVKLFGEQRNGLASILKSCCTACGDRIHLETSPKVKGPNDYKRWECNLAAVWGQMATGGGHNHLQETMSVLGVPVMSKVSFVQTERERLESCGSRRWRRPYWRLVKRRND